ncbi:hypothetical protein KUH03_26325 [Sphingobacterium sp. E70]|uniref:hypothetical protein n=1 Tax=Sphingobacterium sp. E70 TaxID=2853439 RepID=UPI00211BF654|nr:hypothetical protein [Sphingobacterium sp. E70]ULT22809.1 hypothetical protein KUH03_26325 [Sphingobacterium sp. E70]
MEETKRLIFRGSVNNEYGKRLRWDLETSSAIPARHLTFTRNEIMDSQVSLIENKDTASTDLLHEYFIPERNFMKFIQDIKPILLKSKLDLLNITIRAVNRDDDAYLNYAQEDVFGFVLLFNQKKQHSKKPRCRHSQIFWLMQPLKMKEPIIFLIVYTSQKTK